MYGIGNLCSMWGLPNHLGIVLLSGALLSCACSSGWAPLAASFPRASWSTEPGVDLAPLAVGEHVFQRRALSNGLRAVAVRDEDEGVSVFLVVAAGKRQETLATTGLAHLTEHAMYTGTARLDPGEHDARVTKWGGSSNAFTREDYTLFYDHGLPAKRLRKVLTMEADRLRNLSLEKEAVLFERERLRVEEESTWQPSQVLTELLEEAVFQVHPYRVGVMGSDGHTLAPELGVSEIRTFYERYYQPDSVVVVVAGSIDPAKVLDEIEYAFGGLPSGPLRERLPEEPEITEPRSVRIPSTLPRDRLEWVWLIPAMGHPDRAALGVFGRILARRTIHDGTSLSVSLGDRVDKDLFRVAAAGPRAEADLAAALAALLAGQLEEAEVEDVKRLIRNWFRGQKLRSRPYFSLAGAFGVAEALGHAEDLAAFEATLEGLTSEDVLRVARDRLDPSKRVSVLFAGTGAELAPLPEDDHALQRAAVEAVQAGNYDWAIAAFTEALIRDPSKMNQVIMLGDRGQTYLKQRDFNAAIADFERALELFEYPDLRDLLDEARARRAGIAPSRSSGRSGEEEGEDAAPKALQKTGAHEQGIASAHPVAGEATDVDFRSSLVGRLDASQRQLEEWRGVAFRKEIVPELIAPQDDDKLLGWYEADSGRLVVVEGNSDRLSQGTLLHELHHALQDQHWDLGSLHDGIRDRDEARALQGLIEGEAMLAVSEIMEHDIEQYMVLPIEGELQRARFEKIYQYGMGLRFVKALRERGGWAAVDQAWKAPPRSSAEIFHPERYPMPAQAIGFSPAAVAGEVLKEDRHGEFELRWLVAREVTTRPLVDDIAAHFVSDRWRRVRTPDAVEHEIWDLRFEDIAAAERFANECRSAIHREGWAVELMGRDVRMRRVAPETPLE